MKGLDDVRHRFASGLLSKGVSTVYVEETRGHSSIQNAGDVYGRRLPSGENPLVKRLDESAPTGTPPAPAESRKAATL